MIVPRGVKVGCCRNRTCGLRFCLGSHFFFCRRWFRAGSTLQDRGQVGAEVCSRSVAAVVPGLFRVCSGFVPAVVPGLIRVASPVSPDIVGAACASVAQLAEQRFCKPQVVGSSPTAGFKGNFVRTGNSRFAGLCNESSTRYSPASRCRCVVGPSVPFGRWSGVCFDCS